MLSARGQLASARANINMLSARGLPTPPAAAPPPPAPALDIGFQAASSHAALTRLLAMQTELDACAVENVRLGAALSESRVECDTLRADLALAERAADGRWRAADRSHRSGERDHRAGCGVAVRRPRHGVRSLVRLTRVSPRRPRRRCRAGRAGARATPPAAPNAASCARTARHRGRSRVGGVQRRAARGRPRGRPARAPRG